MAFLIQKKVDGSDGQRWELSNIPLVVGRGEQAHARINDSEMSRQHFQIEIKEGACILRDLQSKNGTTVNGQRITETQLKPNDRIHAGESSFLFADKAISEAMPTLTGQHHPKQLRRE